MSKRQLSTTPKCRYCSAMMFSTEWLLMKWTIKTGWLISKSTNNALSMTYIAAVDSITAAMWVVRHCSNNNARSLCRAHGLSWDCQKISQMRSRMRQRAASNYSAIIIFPHSHQTNSTKMRLSESRVKLAWTLPSVSILFKVEQMQQKNAPFLRVKIIYLLFLSDFVGIVWYG